MQTNTSALLEWQAATRIDYERSKSWYVWAGLFCLVMIVYGILSSSWSLAIVFALCPGLYFLVRNQPHPTHTIRIFDNGIEWDGRLMAWGDFNEFWILQGKGYYELHVGSPKAFKRDLVVLTGDRDPHQIRDVLSRFLPQTASHRERTMDAVARFLKL
ncbi:MAG: hypothetical protein PHZ00_02520 [Candidatus Peribacteraceae bacterium]|nr:hypothetical protein [Candidatus Peribacteraceae bacterium]